MALTNYSDLQTTVASYLHRGDLTSMIPDFISLAEAKLNRRLRIRAMENIATGTTGISAALPTGYLEMRGITVSDGASTWPLTYIPPTSLRTSASAPVRYTLIGDDIYFVGQSSSYTYTLTYYKGFDPLSAGVNWLMTNAPDVYLYATLLEASPYIEKDGRILVWQEALEQSIARLNQADDQDRYGSNLAVVAA